MTDFSDDDIGGGIGLPSTLGASLARAGADMEALADGPARRASDAIAAAFERTGESIERTLSRAATRGETDFARMTENILRDLARLAAERFIEQPLTGLIARSLDRIDLFGARADGGPVVPGGAYLVGERGPELFTPTSAGQIGPPAGGPSITVNLALPPGPSGTADLSGLSQGRLARALARAVSQGSRWR